MTYNELFKDLKILFLDKLNNRIIYQLPFEDEEKLYLLNLFYDNFNESFLNNYYILNIDEKMLDADIIYIIKQDFKEIPDFCFVMPVLSVLKYYNQRTRIVTYSTGKGGELMYEHFLTAKKNKLNYDRKKILAYL